jgi:hypothetical protein
MTVPLIAPNREVSDTDTSDGVELPRSRHLLSPFLRGVTFDGALSYERLWQHRNVVLFVLPARAITAVEPYPRSKCPECPP